MIEVLKRLDRLRIDSRDPLNVSHLLILCIVAENPGLTLDEIMQKAGWKGRHTARRRVNILADKDMDGYRAVGLLRRVADRQSYLTYRYFATAKGQRVYNLLNQDRA